MRGGFGRKLQAFAGFSRRQRMRQQLRTRRPGSYIIAVERERSTYYSHRCLGPLLSLIVGKPVARNHLHESMNRQAVFVPFHQRVAPQLGDRIVTGPGGGLQILLLDGTTFSIGPNTSLVIDEFVFNPATGTGRLTASVARGTLRVISGRLARQEQEAIRIRLPVATVGVRGTMALFMIQPNGASFIGLFGIGGDNSVGRPQSHLFIHNNGGGTGIYRTNFGCTVTPANPVCIPKQVGPELLHMLLGQVGGQIPQFSLEELKLRTGLDLVEALRLMGKPGGFEDIMQILTDLQQDRSRPGGPPSTPPAPPID